MKSIILHIGTEKTGSTSLQKALHVNRKALEDRGILYPKSAGGVNSFNLLALSLDPARSAGYFIEKGLTDESTRLKWAEHIFDALSSEIELSKAEFILFSLEHLSRLLSDRSSIRRLKSYLLRLADHVEIVVYLRPQDEFQVSWYSTKVKTGYTGEFRFPSQYDKDWLGVDYLNLLDRWSQEFSQEAIKIRSYSRASSLNNGVVEDFFSYLGVPLSEMEVFARENEGIDAASLFILREVNKYLGGSYVNGEVNRYRESLRLAFEVTSSGQAFYPAFQDRLEFMERFFEDNKVINDRFCSGEVVLPTAESELSHKSPYDITPSEEMIYGKIADLWRFQTDRIVDLRLRLERAQKCCLSR